jgi:hypothetical protein
MVGLSIRRIDRDGLKQAQRKILREVEMQFVYTRQAGIRTDVNGIQRVPANAYPDAFATVAKSGPVQDKIETAWCR